MDLVTHIMKRFGNRPGESRHFNAIINAANMILAEFQRESVKATPGMGLDAWLRCDDKGRSSEYLASVLCGFSREFAYPHDPDDFGRCYRLLRAVPQAREKWDALKTLAEPWPTLAIHWEELEKFFEEEGPTGRAPRLYDRLQELYKTVGVS